MSIKYFGSSIISRLYWLSITVLYKTARIRTLGEGPVRELLSGNRKALFCFFHGDYLPLIPHFGSPDFCIFTTQSKRGELLAQAIRLFGYSPRFIPDKRGSRLALNKMVEEIEKGYHAVIVVDGPLGPYHKVKHGIVILAQRTGNPIVPIGIASSWKIVLKKRWDRYTIPLPFSRTVIAFGEPAYIPTISDRKRIEFFRKKIEDELLHLNQVAQESLIRQDESSAV